MKSPAHEPPLRATTLYHLDTQIHCSDRQYQVWITRTRVSITADASLISEHAKVCRECPPQVQVLKCWPHLVILFWKILSILGCGYKLEEEGPRRHAGRGYTWLLGRGYVWRLLLSVLLVSILSLMNWIALLQHCLLSTIWNLTHQELILHDHFSWTETFPTWGRWDTHKVQEIKSQVTGKPWNLQDWHCWFPALYKSQWLLGRWDSGQQSWHQAVQRTPGMQISWSGHASSALGHSLFCERFQHPH